MNRWTVVVVVVVMKTWVLDRVFPILVCFGDYVLNTGI
jgi:hypothetical protein